MNRKTVIEIAGVEYEAALGKITRAPLGWEDHGIFTAYLVFEGPGWGQGEPARGWDGFHLKLYLETVMKTLSVNDWSQVVGQEAYVLRKSGFIVGFAHRSEERYMFFQDVADTVDPSDKVAVSQRKAVEELTKPRNPAETN